jgi:hypothetical protein
MKFQKTIDISESDIIQEMCDTFNNEKRKNLIMKMLPEDYVGNLDLEFLLTIMKLLSSKLISEVNGTGTETEAKKISKEIKNLHKKLLEEGWI